ncbi:MAG: YgfZ/GcvT domain-containing protein [Acidothermaceae bacterium]
MTLPDDAAFRSPLLGLPGAVTADAPDLGVAGHYGDPIREQRRIADGGADGDGWVDLSHRDVVRIEGQDRLSWLHNLTTQRLDKLEAGMGTEALILSPQGRVEHHLQLVDDGDAIWIHLEPGGAASLVAFLDSMRFMLRVDVADVTAEWAVVWQLSNEPHPSYLARVDPQAANTPSDAVAGRQLFVPRDQLTAFASAAIDRGEAPAGVLALEALRIEAGRPRFGVDTDDRTIPHEMGWIGGAVQLNKGCYRGQETVAHVANLGRPPRRLIRLHLDGSVRESLPAAGTAIQSDGVTIGRLTSSAYHYELGPIALGVVKYATADDVEVSVGSAEPTATSTGSAEPVAARIESIVERDDSPRPGQAARAAFGRKSLL